MDTVYSTKKYFQNLGQDYYRTSGAMRPMVSPSNDYTSYHNTLGRRSTVVGPYTHMNQNKYSYPTDVSVSSQYGYNTWGMGMWRGGGGGGDTRNISPSTYSQKYGHAGMGGGGGGSGGTAGSGNGKSIKSFSIILMTAAFIVVLAVLSVAGLAFYFSTFRSDVDDSILVFDGSFRVNRGDVYTTGLKYNHTSSYRQKSEFYERLIGQAFTNNGLSLSKCEILGFGDGPLVDVQFRVFLDMRKLPMSLSNVEYHIGNAILNEVSIPNNVYKNLRIDPDSIEIKRLLDHEVLRTASFIRDPTTNHVNSSMNFDEKINKKTGVIEKTIQKFSTNGGGVAGAGVGGGTSISGKDKIRGSVETVTVTITEKAPVILGSFEITKTEADITQKRNNLATTPVHPSPNRVKQQQPVGHHKSGDSQSGTTLPAKPSTAMFSSTTTMSSNIIKSDLTNVREQISTASSTGRVQMTTSRSATKQTAPTLIALSPSTTVRTAIVPTVPASPIKEQSFDDSGNSTAETSKIVATELMNLTGNTAINNHSTTSTELPEGFFNWTSIIVDRADSVDDTKHRHEGPGLDEPVQIELLANVQQSVPQLDANLFTSAPVIDKEPWRPIKPSGGLQKDPTEMGDVQPKIAVPQNSLRIPHPSPAGTALFNDKENTLKNNHKFSNPIVADTHSDNPGRPVHYQSYTNPTFAISTLGIERLGTGDVKPYPLPVNKLYDDPSVPDFKYLDTTKLNEGEILRSPPANIIVQPPALIDLLGNDKFEHLGGGVIVKRPEATDGSMVSELSDATPLNQQDAIGMTTVDFVDTTTAETEQQQTFDITTRLPSEQSITTDQPPQIKHGDILFDLLEFKNDEKNNPSTIESIESRIVGDFLDGGDGGDGEFMQNMTVNSMESMVEVDDNNNQTAAELEVFERNSQQQASSEIYSEIKLTAAPVRSTIKPKIKVANSEAASVSGVMKPDIVAASKTATEHRKPEAIFSVAKAEDGQTIATMELNTHRTRPTAISTTTTKRMMTTKRPRPTRKQKPRTTTTAATSTTTTPTTTTTTLTPQPETDAPSLAIIDDISLATTFASSASIEVTTPTVEATTKETLIQPTSAYVEVETMQYTPASPIMQPQPSVPDQQISLFPMFSKWEFLNSSGANPTRKIFNETLQALVVENSQMMKYDKKGSRPEMDVKRPDTESIQNISTIFDTLSSKLGIIQNVPNKAPPFTGMLPQKLKTAINKTVNANAVGIKMMAKIPSPSTTQATTMPTLSPSSTTRTTTPTTTLTTTNMPLPSTFSSITIHRTTQAPSIYVEPHTIHLPNNIESFNGTPERPPLQNWGDTIETRAPITEATAVAVEVAPSAPAVAVHDGSSDSMPIMMTPPSSERAQLALDSSPETIVGEAEIEEVDPTHYEEIMKANKGLVSVGTMVPPPLVTLLPVKSNSGIRTFRLPQKGFVASASTQPSLAVKGIDNLRLTNMETIVRTAVHVNS